MPVLEKVEPSLGPAIGPVSLYNAFSLECRHCSGVDSQGTHGSHGSDAHVNKSYVYGIQCSSLSKI